MAEDDGVVVAFPAPGGRPPVRRPVTTVRIAELAYWSDVIDRGGIGSVPEDVMARLFESDPEFWGRVLRRNDVTLDDAGTGTGGSPSSIAERWTALRAYCARWGVPWPVPGVACHVGADPGPVELAARSIADKVGRPAHGVGWGAPPVFPGPINPVSTKGPDDAA